MSGASARPLPSPGEIQVWTTRLDRPDVREEALSADERERASRFHFARDGRAYAAGRTWLREVLAGYLGVAPSGVAFGYGPHGKPCLAPGPAGEPEHALRFNLSHSGDHAVLAVATGHEVGIDIEAHRGVERDLPARFFSRAEVAALSGVPAPDREAAFFAAWTRKEAYLKALGSGLAKPLDGFTVSLAPGAPPALLAVAGDPDEAARWQMATFPVRPGYSAALACRARGWTLRLMPDG